MCSRLEAVFPAGDRDKVLPFRSLSQITDIGGASLRTTELKDALFDGDINILVHSLKDVPSKLKEDVFAATPALKS